MKNFRMAALFLTAVIALTPAISCRANAKPVEESSSISLYADNPEIGKNKIDVSVNEDTNLNNTSYKINSIIDSGKRSENLKYIYLDVTIKNDSDKDYDLNSLNNFYLIMDDGSETLTDVRADIYGKQYINNYEQLLSVPAGGEYNGYIGFLIDEDINTFTVGFFATADSNDKSSVVLCKVTKDDIISPPDGMIKSPEETQTAEN